ncbi:MAG: hypothetical protein NT175_08680 [Bacteroidetes bacterium]|nr:hypothetical protein [Bacteroidota bacterium]
MPALLIKERELLSPTSYLTGASCNRKHSCNYKINKEWRNTEEIDDYIHLWTKKSGTIKVAITKKTSIEVKTIFHELIEKIQSSKFILELKDNWDDEDSKGYSEKTYVNAINFFKRYAQWIWDERGVIIDTPNILPSNEGSIDLFWSKMEYDLLINIPAYPNNVARFYGDNKKDSKIEGEFPLNSYNQGIFLSLLQS